MSIPVYHEGEVLLYIPCPYYNFSEICENFCTLNSGIKTVIRDNKSIVITDMTYMQRVPGTRDPYITVETYYGQFFIPAFTFRKGDIQNSMNDFYWLNQYSTRVNENTMSLVY
jgi:hypothetical protein